MSKHNFKFISSGIRDGNMSFRYGDPAEVVAQRQKFFAREGIDLTQAVFPKLAHDTHIEEVAQAHAGSGATDRETEIRAEALITQDPSVVLALLTADCFPVGFFDPTMGIRALAHLGRIPTALHLAHKVVHEMVTRYGANPQNILVHIGPGIQAPSYIFTELPPEIKTNEWRECVTPTKDGRNAIDLSKFIITDLVRGGVRREHIFIDPRDTYVDLNPFSHVRSQQNNEPEGRFVTVFGA